MKCTLATALATAGLLTAVAAQTNYPPPGKVTGDNRTWEDDGNGPWGGIHVHDPSIVKHNGKYYSFSTHNLVSISEAPSWEGPWRIIGSVLDQESVIDNAGRADPWAPDVQKIGDTYYCYYAVSQFGSQNSSIGLATSKKLLPGTWKDHGEVITSSPDAEWPFNTTNAIDANLFVEPKGKHGKKQEAYLTYGSFWSNIFQVELSSNLKKLARNGAADAAWLSFDGSIDTHPEEGPYLHLADNGWYYLYVSHGICCGYQTTMPEPGTEYKIIYGRSRSPRGPFLDKNGVDMKNGGGTVILASHDNVYGPGGQGVINDDGTDILYYHYADASVNYDDRNKLLGYNVICYDNDDWPYLV